MATSAAVQAARRKRIFVEVEAEAERRAVAKVCGGSTRQMDENAGTVHADA